MKSQSSNAINQTLSRRNEKVWMSGFYDRALRREEDIVQIARYIVANPIRDGLVENVGDYPLWHSIWV